MCIVTLTSEIWPWVKVMTHPWVMDNNCVKYYPESTWQWGVMARTPISSICALWPWPWVKVMTHPCVMDINCVKYYPDPTWQWGVMARTRISRMCALWPWPWRYDLRSRSWHTLGSWTTIMWNIIQIQLGSEELWPGHGFPVCAHYDLDLEDMTLCQGHGTPPDDTPLGHGQQLCEIISRSDKGVRSYGPYTMWTDGQTDGRTDRQTGWFLYTLPNFVCGGGTKPGSVTIIVWSIIQIQVTREIVKLPGKNCHVYTVTLALAKWPWPRANDCVIYYQDMVFGICALWPWPRRYDLGSRLWHTLVSCTTIVWNIAQIQLGSNELWPGHRFWVYVHCGIDLADMTLGQSHGTTLSCGQPLREIL